jgi:hypothetical protein
VGDLIISDTVIKMWMKELAEVSQRIEADRKKCEILNKKLEAVTLLYSANENKQIRSFSEDPELDTSKERNFHPNKSIMKLSPRETILYWIRRSPNEGVAIHYIRECIQASGYPMDAFGKNGAYFYTLLSRLQKSGKIIREGDKVILNHPD